MMNMNHCDREVIVEEKEIDKISNLPKDIFNEIFKDMSIRELTKMCVLSKKWKYFSAMMKNVKELTLNNYNHNPYTLPFDIFSCSTLKYLDVINCIVNLPYSTTLFPNLHELNLEFITFNPTIANHVLNIPLLSTLTFTFCDGLHFLNIFPPKIEFLTIHESHEIRADFFDNFSDIRVLCMVIFLEESGNYEQGRFITWSRLLCLGPNLTRLALSNACIRLLGAEIIPKSFPSKLHHLEHVKLRVEIGDLNQVSGVFSLIGSSPSLLSLEMD
ncbi:hypothetical protein H5410_035571, partial [Solanum commersonii]